MADHTCKPQPPIKLIEGHIRKYWNMQLTLDKMTAALQQHFDTNKYQMGAKTLSRILKELGLEGVRKQHHTVESISETMIELRSRYPNIGCREAVNVFSSDYEMRVARDVVRAWCNLHEPDAVKAQMRQRFHRRIFYSAGVNHLWSVDQHDKWKWFHLYLHLGMDVFSRKLLWVRIWWSNSNPRLITSFFLDAVAESGGLALITQSDPGSENYGIANAQTVMRQTLDPNLQGSLQHRWAFKHGNIPAEIMWSQIRKRFSFGFENLPQHGVNMKYYNTNDWVHVLVFWWLGIPWLQAELDRFRHRFNNHKPRFDPKKVAPCAAPALLFEQPGLYASRDFKVLVPNDIVETARQQWAPPEHEVFQLVPDQFAQIISHLYAQIGKPAVSVHTFWAVYNVLLEEVENYSGDQNVMPAIEQEYRLSMERARDGNDMAILEGQAPLDDVDTLLVNTEVIEKEGSEYGSDDEQADREVYDAFNTDTEDENGPLY